MKPYMTVVLALLPLLVASAPIERYTTEELYLARICVHEAGWHDTNDCEAIWQVFQSRKQLPAWRDRPMAALMAAYARKAIFGRRNGVRSNQPWVAGLSVRYTRRPPAFPQNLSWQRHSVWWRDRLNEAKHIIATNPVVCAEQPDHWGATYGPFSRRHRPPFRWRKVDCGNTRNYYWKVPGR